MTKKSLFKKAILLIFTISILSTSLFQVANAQLLELTVTTDKNEYGANENITINGTLRYDGTPVSNVLIGLEIRDREGQPYIFRTLPCGSITQTNWLVNITQLYPCNSSGVPTYTFQKGQIVWLFCAVKNFDPYDDHYAIVCVTLYGPYNTPIIARYLTAQTITRGNTVSIFTSLIKIETAMPSGTYQLYASVFNGYPQHKGLPYCPEKMANFSVITSEPYPPQPQPPQDGIYQTTYYISSQVRLGNFTAYVSVRYMGITATASTTFKAVLKGDINKDNLVNYKDAIILGAAFGSRPGDPNWNSNADINGDGVVNYRDAIILGANFGSIGY